MIYMMIYDDMIYDMIRCDIKWYDMIYDKIWYDIWYDMIRYDGVLKQQLYWSFPPSGSPNCFFPLLHFFPSRIIHSLKAFNEIKSQFESTGRATAFCLPRNVQNGSAAHTAGRLFNTGGNFLVGAELANHHDLVSRLRMSGAIPLLPYMPSRLSQRKKINRKSYLIITFNPKCIGRMSTTFGVTMT